MRENGNTSVGFVPKVRKTIVTLALAPILFTSCKNDSETITELNSYPMRIISTPIYTSNIPTAVMESQTPINLESSKAVVINSNNPVIHYGAIVLNSVVNSGGKTLTVNVTGADSFNNYITIAGKKYNLVNFHFHYSSEHTVDGKYSTMEIHFVNVSADNSYAVLGVMVDIGNGNSSLQNLFTQSPTVSDAVNSPNTIFYLSNLLPSNTKQYFTYSGSLTTPNLGANSSIANGGPVTWFVFMHKQQLSDAQLNSYKQIYPNPYFRTIQPLNGRTLYANGKL